MGAFALPNGIILRWLVSDFVSTYDNCNTSDTGRNRYFMKKYLHITLTLMLFALLCAVLLFWYVTGANNQSIERPETTSFDKTSVTAQEGSQSTNEALGGSDTGSIPLKDVPLSDSQRETLETAGIDTEEFVITEAMIACAEGKLGVERVAEIVGGAKPSYLEMAKLSLCVKAE